MKTEKKDQNSATLEKEISRDYRKVLVISIIFLVAFCAGFCFYLGTQLSEKDEVGNVSEQREFIKTAKVGLIDSWSYFGKINDLYCKKLILKDGTVLYLPVKMKVPTTFEFAGTIRTYDDTFPKLHDGECIAYETDSITNIISRLSIIPIEWGITEDTAKVWKIEDGGVLNGGRWKIITTTEYRHLLCPDGWVEREKLDRDSVFRFETQPETKRVTGISRISH